MARRIHFILVFSLCLFGFASQLFCADVTPVKCLMIGKEPHNEANVWEDVIVEIQSNYPSVQLTVVEKNNLEALHYENLKQFDVLLIVQMQVEGGNPPDAVKQGIQQFLENGGGLVVNHFAVANVQNWRDSIDIFGAMWVNGKSTHYPLHTFQLEIQDEAHPILEGVKPFVTDDELYFNLLMRPDMNVIMTADEERFGQMVAEPMLCTHYFKNARCVYFALGHNEGACKPAEFRKIIVQTIEWAACRR